MDLSFFAFWTLQASLVAGEFEERSSLDEMIESSRGPKTRFNLTCHVCHSERDKRCFDFEGGRGDDLTGVCPGVKDVCLVRRFSFTVSNGTGASLQKTFAMKRNCSRNCESGCVIMGERTRIYVCSSCCSTPLCNTDNAGWTNRASGLLLPLFILLSIKQCGQF